MPYGTVNVDSLTSSNGGTISPNITSLRNRIINGGMVIDQRYAGAVQSPAPSGYGADRWAIYKSGTGTWSYQLSSTAPAGFTSSLLLTVTGTSTPSGNDYYILQQPIEGFNVADLNWGSSNAQAVTLSFWARSSVTGTFSGALRNASTNRCYPFTYSISSANTFEYKTVTITGDQSGTWGTTNGAGIYLNFCFGGAGTSLGTGGSWNANSNVGATGQTNWISNSGATFYITGVQLEKGSTATSFDYRPYGTELQLCQRYFETNMKAGSAIADGQQLPDRILGVAFGATTIGYTINFQVSKRAQPGITLYAGSNNTTIAGRWCYYTGSWVQFSVQAAAYWSNSSISVDLTSTGLTTYSTYLLQGGWAASAEL